MGWVLNLILFLVGFLIALPIFTIIMLKINKDIKRVDVPPNMPFVQNIVRKQFTDGYYLGVLKRQRENKNGTTLIEFYPLDVRQGELTPRPDIQQVIVRNELIDRESPGDLSERRDIMILLGRNPADYPKKFREHIEGKWMTSQGQLGHIIATFGNFVKYGDQAIEEAQKHYARGNITKSVLMSMQHDLDKLKKMLTLAMPQSQTGTGEKSTANP